MTNEEFKKIPFKYDGDGNPVTFGEAGMFWWCCYRLWTAEDED